MTNGDLLRSLSDEELSHKLCDLMVGCGHCIAYHKCNSWTEGDGNGIMKWLKENAEDVTDNS
jgi:hypothetical protein